jgi:hypothetical protein
MEYVDSNAVVLGQSKTDARSFRHPECSLPPSRRNAAYLTATKAVDGFYR